IRLWRKRRLRQCCDCIIVRGRCRVRSREVGTLYADRIEERIAETGQHLLASVGRRKDGRMRNGQRDETSETAGQTETGAHMVLPSNESSRRMLSMKIGL